MENQRIKEFLEEVESLKLRFPVATIARETGYTKGMISKLLKGKEEPSVAFLNKFRESFFKGEHNKQSDAKQTLEDSATLYGAANIKSDRSVDAILQIMKKQVDTIANQHNTINSQQETIKLLTTKLISGFAS